MPIDKICLDLETTGLCGVYDEIIELAIISYDGEVLFNHRFKPTRFKSWPEASEVNGIYPEDLRNEKTIEYYRDDIQKILDEAEAIIGYNVNFDYKFLRHSQFVFRKKRISVMGLFARIYGAYDEYWESFIWQSLKTCADYYDYDWGSTKAHGALADALATLYCYKKITAHDHA